jgi:hypothetical protein
MNIAEQDARAVGAGQGRDVIARLVEIREQLGCMVVDGPRCDGTDVISLQILCSARQTAERWSGLLAK